MMFPISNHLRAFVLGLATSAPAVLGTCAQPAPDRKGPDRFEIRARVEPVAWETAFRGSYGKIESRKDGTACFSLGLRAIGDHPLFPTARRDGYGFHYARLGPEDVVWLIDGFYQIEAIPTMLRRLGDAELPAGLAPKRGTYLFPLGGGGTLYWVDGDGFELILPDECQRDPSGTARVELVIMDKARPVTAAELAELRKRTDPARVPDFAKHRVRRELCIREGEVLSFGDKRHRVRRVVPPDPVRRMPGWIEIDQQATMDRRTVTGGKTE